MVALPRSSPMAVPVVRREIGVMARTAAPHGWPCSASSWASLCHHGEQDVGHAGVRGPRDCPNLGQSQPHHPHPASRSRSPRPGEGGRGSVQPEPHHAGGHGRPSRGRGRGGQRIRPHGSGLPGHLADMPGQVDTPGQFPSVAGQRPRRHDSSQHRGNIRQAPSDMGADVGERGRGAAGEESQNRDAPDLLRAAGAFHLEEEGIGRGHSAPFPRLAVSRPLRTSSRPRPAGACNSPS
ncbi:hypothetical protein Francci3_1981 [Frankia casuarinae]|uniref:Uncharacterized protein n=1 Tax=Frankia casuarinae (strain DSM 45818 / CECT 9043 / HFP020203 / CcI3) TaxID=106370 RepID=Q2JBI7_FRACC|nr:hypothetical protein Francci3_1981 [Frankia casuarinae]